MNKSDNIVLKRISSNGNTYTQLVEIIMNWFKHFGRKFGMTHYFWIFMYLENVRFSVMSDCDPRDCSPPGSSVHGILQARILKWAAIPFSRGPSQPNDRTWVSCTAGRFFTIWATREASSPFGYVAWRTTGTHAPKAVCKSIHCSAVGIVKNIN